MSYKIGSFNLYKFSYQSDKDIKKDFEKIAEIIRNEGFDIIALQEVFSEDAVKYLMRFLGASEWDYCWDSPRKSLSVQEAEGYAFIWNKRRMELAPKNELQYEGGTLVNKRGSTQPAIFNQYRIDRARGQSELARNPYYARFKPLHSSCEIRLINVHLRVRARKDDSLGESRDRKKEIEILTESIFHKLNNKVYGNNLPAYTIMLGDYNLNLKRDGYKSPYIEEIIKITDNGRVEIIRTTQESKTTLKIKNPEEKDKRDYWANNYDHFTYDDKNNPYVRSVTKIDTVEKYCNGDFALHRKKISDHAPISMELNLNNEGE